MRILLQICSLVLLALTASPLVRAEAPVNTTLLGVAIKGYDPVAYFTDAKPIKGEADHTYEWNGAKWRFANAEHLTLFKASPEKYAPQFGGYCAWAVSRGYTASIDPTAWKIIEGKLYLNYSHDVQKTWEQDVTGNIQKAEQNWPGILKK